MLASSSTKPQELASKLAPTGLCSADAGDKADRSPHPPRRKAPHAGGCNCTCRSELVSRALQRNPKSSRASSLLQGLCSADAGDKAYRSPHPPRRKAPHAGSCNRTCRSELARELLQGLCSRVGVSLCAFCSSTRPRPGSGRRTGSIRQRWRPCPPDAPPG